MALVVKSDDGKKLMVLDHGYAASYKDGKWVGKALFNGYELGEHFTRVTDASEVQAILQEAQKHVKRLTTA
jgi:hypothetical protein